jgi:putative membrane protein insertion efficiency factor
MTPSGYGRLDLEERPVPTVNDPAGTTGTGWAGRRAVAAIRVYQAARSGRPTGCRYIPSCSEYATEAIEVHGAARGALMAAKRVLRCTPWGGHGIDPVPGRTSCTHP